MKSIKARPGAVCTWKKKTLKSIYFLELNLNSFILILWDWVEILKTIIKKNRY
jgi:hypothetical protein